MPAIEELLRQYSEHAKAHYEFLLKADHEQANWNYDELMALLEELAKPEYSGGTALLRLLDVEDPTVRLAAASHCLNIDEPRSLGVLRKLAKSKGLNGFRAELVLEEWKKGNLRIPFLRREE